MDRIAIVVALVATACNRDCPPQPASSPAPTIALDAAVVVNPVQHEMRLLHAALQTTLTGIAYGDVRAVPAAFEEIDRAGVATEAALASGRYVLERNVDHLEHFRELDESFHIDLEKIPESAASNNVPATAEALGPVLRACQPCHGEFRKK